MNLGLLLLLFDAAELAGDLHFLHLQLLLLQLCLHLVHDALLLQLVLHLDHLHSLLTSGMVGPVDWPHVVYYVCSLLPHYLQLVPPSRLVVLQLDLQALLIVDAVLVDLPYVLDRLHNELLGLNALPPACFQASGAVKIGLGAAVLVEIIQTDNHIRK